MAQLYNLAFGRGCQTPRARCYQISDWLVLQICLECEGQRCGAQRVRKTRVRSCGMPKRAPLHQKRALYSRKSEGQLSTPRAPSTLIMAITAGSAMVLGGSGARRRRGGCFVSGRSPCFLAHARTFSYKCNKNSPDDHHLALLDLPATGAHLGSVL